MTSKSNTRPKVSFHKEVAGSLDTVVASVTAALQTEGFGILTRIDFHAKLHERLGKVVPPTVILGACHPQLAFEAFTINSDVAALMPCNAVVREVSAGRMRVELSSAVALLEVLHDSQLDSLAQDVDQRLTRALDAMK